MNVEGLQKEIQGIMTEIKEQKIDTSKLTAALEKTNAAISEADHVIASSGLSVFCN